MRVLPNEEMRVCNCCVCGALMLGEQQTQQVYEGKITFRAEIPPPVYTRSQDRPYCEKCWKTLDADVYGHSGRTARRIVRKPTGGDRDPDSNGGWSNVAKAMDEDR
jgi:hypothetical protein